MSTEVPHTPSVSRATLRGFLLAEIAFVLLAAVLAARVLVGAQRNELWWMLPALALVGLLIADLVSGLAHFLADNFASPDTPLIGPTFVRPFREHHADPTAITGHGFIEANGGNTLASLPVIVPTVLWLPVEDSILGTVVGSVALFFLIPIWLTNQIHKWAHMPSPPRLVRWFQRAGLILANEHHDVHHRSPFDTYYCITVGAWNPLLERMHFFEKAERLIRRWIPGTDPVSRVERDAAGRTGVAIEFSMRR